MFLLRRRPGAVRSVALHVGRPRAGCMQVLSDRDHPSPVIMGFVFPACEKKKARKKTQIKRKVQKKLNSHQKHHTHRERDIRLLLLLVKQLPYSLQKKKRSMNENTKKTKQKITPRVIIKLLSNTSHTQIFDVCCYWFNNSLRQTRILVVSDSTPDIHHHVCFLSL